MASTPAANNVEALLFRPQHLFGEHGVGRFEKAAEETVDESACDAVAQAAGEHLAAVECRNLRRVRAALRDHEVRIALVHAHAAPDLRHQHADVVIHAHLRADVAGRSGEAGVAGQDRGHQRVVQVDHRPQRVERSLW